MAFAESGRSTLAYVVESTYGTTPGTPTMLNLRFIEHNLATAKSALRSAERRSDRQVPFVRHGQKTVAATIQCELSYLAFKDWIRAALGYATTTGGFVSTAGTDTAFASSTKKITRTSGSWVTDGAVVGMKCRVTSAAQAGNNQVVTLTAVSALELTVEETLTDEAASANVKINGNYAELGTTKTSFSVEAAFPDVSEYEVFTGVVPTGFSINASPDEIVGLSFPVIGKESDGSTATALDASVDDVNTAEPVDSYSAGAGKILEGGSAIALITSLQLSVDNNRNAQMVLGNDSAVGVSMGTAAVTGTLSAYFQDEALLAKFINETASSLEVEFQDPAGNAFHVELFAIKYTGANKSVSGEDNVMLEMPFEAYMDTTTGDTIRVNMIPATAT